MKVVPPEASLARAGDLERRKFRVMGSKLVYRGYGSMVSATKTFSAPNIISNLFTANEFRRY